MRTGRWSLAGQVFALQLVLLSLVTVVWAGLAVLDARRDGDRAAAQLPVILGVVVAGLSVAVAGSPRAAWWTGASITAGRSPEDTLPLAGIPGRVIRMNGVHGVVRASTIAVPNSRSLLLGSTR
ncbi:hypothetical protein [Nocardia sp. X0981]